MPQIQLPLNRRSSIPAFDGFSDISLDDHDYNGCCSWRSRLRRLCDFLRALPWHRVRRFFNAPQELVCRAWKFLAALSWPQIRSAVVRLLHATYEFLRCTPEHVRFLLHAVREFLRCTPKHARYVLYCLSWKCIHGMVIAWWWRRYGAEE